jgi:hypothetical protein
MKIPKKTKNEAIKLRKKGCSIQEISKKLHIARSTVSLFSKSIKLNQKAIKRLEKRKQFGKLKWQKISKEKRRDIAYINNTWAKNTFSKIKPSQELYRLICATLYWAEGGKTNITRLEFTNSDPEILKCFLKSLKNGFEFEIQKVRLNIHIHEYHNDQKLKKYWSNTLKIPLTQFNKSYLKPHTQKRIKLGYNGCVRICYNCAEIARKIKVIYSSINKYI